MWNGRVATEAPAAGARSTFSSRDPSSTTRIVAPGTSLLTAARTMATLSSSFQAGRKIRVLLWGVGPGDSGREPNIGVRTGLALCLEPALGAGGRHADQGSQGDDQREGRVGGQLRGVAGVEVDRAAAGLIRRAGPGPAGAAGAAATAPAAVARVAGDHGGGAEVVLGAVEGARGGVASLIAGGGVPAAGLERKDVLVGGRAARGRCPGVDRLRGRDRGNGKGSKEDGRCDGQCSSPPPAPHQETGPVPAR